MISCKKFLIGLMLCFAAKTVHAHQNIVKVKTLTLGRGISFQELELLDRQYTRTIQELGQQEKELRQQREENITKMGAKTLRALNEQLRSISSKIGKLSYKQQAIRKELTRRCEKPVNRKLYGIVC